MKRTLLSAIVAILAISSMAANAVPISLSQTQNLTVNGQDMIFDFNGLPAGKHAGTVTIASGAGSTPGLDLSGAFPGESEHFFVTLDGASQGSWSCNGPSNNGSTPIAGAVDNSFNFNDCVFSLPLTIDAAALVSLLADGSLSVGVLFGDDVSTFGHNDEVIVTLSYETPEPSIVALMGIGLAGLGFARRKKSA